MKGLEAAPVLPGETLAGKYRVERVLGRGGMGIVVAARHLELEERVAIKFLLRNDDPTAVERFLREARAAAKVKNDHVCRVFDVARLETGEVYLVMEFLEGVDLADRLRAERRFTVGDVASWMIQVCEGLADAHALGIVHRDLKPANVFLAKRGTSTVVKVLDFGISKLPSSEGMTSTSALMGTPVYMSPEQVASARDVDARTDVWSLGVIMYELVSGRQPFTAESLVQLTVKIRETDPEPLGSGVAGFDDVVARCLAKNREDRFASVEELAAALAPFAEAASRLPKTLDESSPAEAAAKSALAETLLDETPAKSPAIPAGEVTLEPLSAAGASRERGAPSTKRRTALALVAIAGVSVVGFAAYRGSTPAVTDPSARDAIPPASVSFENVALPPEPRAEPAPPPPSTSSASASASSPPRAETPPVLTASIASAARPPTPKVTAPPVEPAAVEAPAPRIDAGAQPAAPEPTTPGLRKKRDLDRDDPYAH